MSMTETQKAFVNACKKYSDYEVWESINEFAYDFLNAETVWLDDILDKDSDQSSVCFYGNDNSLSADDAERFAKLFKALVTGECVLKGHKIDENKCLFINDLLFNWSEL